MANRIYVVRMLLVTAACFMSALTIRAQQVQLDHDWYLAGEKMCVAVETSRAESSSKVAYVEISDTEGLQASAIIALTDGRGQGYIYLPASLHSGYYQLSMYTRMGSQALQMQIPIVNIMQKSVADDIDWVEGECDGKPTVSAAPMPSKYIETICRRAENEGHCIYARVSNPSPLTSNLSDIDASLAVVGKEVHVFEGKMLDDSTVVFNTFDVDGSHSIVIEAATSTGEPLQVSVLDPFANILILC